MTLVTNCILCSDKKLTQVLDLGNIPLPNNLPRVDDLEDKRYPLDVVFCEECKLTQLGHWVDPRLMFSHYTYVPSTSKVLSDHFRDMAESLYDKLSLDSQKTVFDIGSNDGLLLSYFMQLGVKNVLGIDPAENIAPLAQARGVRTQVAFFNEDVGLQHEGEADLIIATNCLAHQFSLISFVKGVYSALKDDGVFVVEVPWSKSLLEEVQFDTIYHEHQSYFSLTSLTHLQDYGLYVNDVEVVPVHGGSLRVFFSKSPRTSPRVEFVLSKEESIGLNCSEVWSHMQKYVEEIKQNLVSYLEICWVDSKRVCGLGASAKASVLLNYCDVDRSLLPFVADANPLKQGRAIPGVRIPILKEEEMEEYHPDYVLVLAWNMMRDMKEKVLKYAPDANLIVPIPQVRILGLGSI